MELIKCASRKKGEVEVANIMIIRDTQEKQAGPSKIATASKTRNQRHHSSLARFDEVIEAPA